MNIQSIIAEIDIEISRLQRARFQLNALAETKKPGPGRSPIHTIGVVVQARPARRKMSAAARAKISDAQKSRWAKVREAA